MENRYYHPYRRSIFWPLCFIIGGLLLLLSNLNMLSGSGWDIVLRLWPLLLIIGGIDSIFQRSHFVGPLVIIGIGGVLLLNNLGYINFSWQILLGLWPVLLIALGLDILIGRRDHWGAVIGLLLGTLLIAGVVWLVVSTPWIGQVNQFEGITQTLNGATRATIELNPTLGAMQVSSGAEAGNLVDAHLRHFSNETISTIPYLVQDGQGLFEIKTQGLYLYPAPAITSSNPDWEVKLTSKIPLNLDSKMVMGDQQLNLLETQVNTLNAENVLGRLVVSLPQHGFKQGHLTVVMGQVVVNVPRDANITIKTDTVIVPVSLPAGFERSGNLIVNHNPTSGDPIQLDISNVIGNVVIQTE